MFLRTEFQLEVYSVAIFIYETRVLSHFVTVLHLVIKCICENAKISAVRSLADICFLHVLIRLIRCIIVSVCSSVFKWC